MKKHNDIEYSINYYDLWFSVNYIVEDYRISFEIYEIRSQTENSYDIELDDRICFNGFIKFDGCMEISGSIHFCNISDIENFNNMLLEIRKEAKDKLIDNYID